MGCSVGLEGGKGGKSKNVYDLKWPPAGRELKKRWCVVGVFTQN